MEQLRLVILCVGAICGAACAQDIVANKTEPAVTDKVKDVSVWIHKIDALQEQRLALEEKRIGILVGAHLLTDGEVDVLCTVPNVQSVTFHGIYENGLYASDAAIEKLARLPDLQELHCICGRSTITDEGVQMLASFKKLESLTLTGNFSEKGYDNIGKLVQLRELNLYLNSPVVTERELAFLEKLPNLRKLALYSGFCTPQEPGKQSTLSQVPDAVFSQLQNLNGLEELTIGCSAFTGSGLSHLSKLQSLRKLTLGSRCTNLTLLELHRLKDLPHLTDLAIHGHFNDTVIEILKDLRLLQTLDLRWTQVTPSGVRRLQQALPDCVIRR